MKKQLTVIAILMLIISSVFAQKSNLVFFTEQGESFYVILNGIKQNADARTNVKITDLTSPNYKCKIIFKNSGLGQLDKTIYLNQGTETTYTIRKNNKGSWIIRWMSESPISSSASNPNTYVYSNTEPEPVYNNANQIQTNQTQTNTNTTAPNSANVGINLTDPATGTNLNVNFNTNLKPNQTNTNTSTNTTTTTTTTTTSNDQNGNQNRHFPNQPYNNRNNQRQVTDAVPGYHGPYGCNYPMTNENFATAKKSVSSKNFESSKLTVAKQVITNNCLTTSQIKEIVKLFDFESTRLEYAKFAYSYVYDKGNYFQLNDAFDFESSIDDLNRYISK